MAEMTPSRLRDLLYINASQRPLTRKQKREVYTLMAKQDGGKCRLCNNPSVDGSELCAGHAFYMLATQK